MGLLEVASGKSLWRGMEYYNQNRVANIEQITDTTFSSKVIGSDENKYQVYIDIKHPKKSKCNCPFAEGRLVVCKHMVATYFTIFPEEAQRIIREAEEEQRREDEYNEIREYVYSLSKAELRELLLEYMVDEEELGYW